MKKVYQIVYRFCINEDPTIWFYSNCVFADRSAAEQYIFDLEKEYGAILAEREVVERILIE